MQILALSLVLWQRNGVVTVESPLATTNNIVDDLKACGGTVVHIVDAVLIPCLAKRSKMCTMNPMLDFVPLKKLQLCFR